MEQRHQQVARLPHLTRRQILQLIGGGGTAMALAGCQVQTNPDSGPQVDAPDIEIPDPQVTLPTEDISFRWLDGGGNRTLFQNPLFDAYSGKHSNITVQYDATNMDTLNETIPLGVRNGTAPDVFAIGNKIQHRQAIQDGWCQPLEDLIPDFDEWKSAFPEGAFVPNVHIFDGKIYSFPFAGSGEISELMIYNKHLLQEADLDPESDLDTWDQFRAAAKKITKTGNGQYYGLMNSRTPVKIVEGLLSTAGFQDGLDLRSGEYNYTDTVVAEAVDLVLAMHKDGSLWPDFAGISAAEARGRMPNNVAGLQVDGPFSFVEWEQADFDFDVRPLPTKEKGATYTSTYSYGGGSNVFVSKDSKYTEIAADLFSYIGSLPGQLQMVLRTRGALLPVMPEAGKQAAEHDGALDPKFVKVRDLSAEIMRVEPVPVIRNSDVSKVETKTITPGFSDLLGGMLTGQVTDIKKDLAKLNSELNKELDRAIAAARKKGAEVSREDYVFANWDPTKDYTESDYEQL